jgi:hypothetical protein
MITEKQIPPEAIKAIMRALDLQIRDDLARAALAAALNAWEGAFEQKYHDDKSVALILPLSKEGE